MKWRKQYTQLSPGTQRTYVKERKKTPLPVSSYEKELAASGEKRKLSTAQKTGIHGALTRMAVNAKQRKHCIEI